MSRNQQYSGDQPQNRNNEMSDNPGDGSRKSAVLGHDGARAAAEKVPAQDEQDQSAIEAFGEEGAGIAAKE